MGRCLLLGDVNPQPITKKKIVVPKWDFSHSILDTTFTHFEKQNIKTMPKKLPFLASFPNQDPHRNNTAQPPVAHDHESTDSTSLGFKMFHCHDPGEWTEFSGVMSARHTHTLSTHDAMTNTGACRHFMMKCRLNVNIIEYSFKYESNWHTYFLDGSGIHTSWIPLYCLFTVACLSSELPPIESYQRPHTCQLR